MKLSVQIRIELSTAVATAAVFELDWTPLSPIDGHLNMLWELKTYHLIAHDNRNGNKAA